MKKYGKVIDINSIRFSLLMCAADVYISSHDNHMKDHKEHIHVFLQHGVTISDMSKYFDSFVHKKVFVIASSEVEKRLLMSTTSLTETQIRVTGLPRFDYLERDSGNNKKIVICLTWRLYISQYESVDDFRKEKYYSAIYEIFKDAEFIHKYSILTMKIVIGYILLFRMF